MATDGPHLVPQNTFTTPFEVRVPTASIKRVELQLEGTAWVSIDDLEFEPPPPCSAEREVIDIPNTNPECARDLQECLRIHWPRSLVFSYKIPLRRPSDS